MFKSIFGTKLTKLPSDAEKRFAGKISKICKNPQDKKPFVMINLNKNNPKNSFNEEYGTKVFENLFPLVNSKIYAFGTPENSKEWDKIALVRYQSEKTFCEMVFSQEYQELAPLKKDGLEDSYTSMMNTIMSYQKDLIEN